MQEPNTFAFKIGEKEWVRKMINNGHKEIKETDSILHTMRTGKRWWKK